MSDLTTIINTLTAHTTGHTNGVHSALAKLSDEELARLRPAISSYMSGSFSGLRVLGELISGFDSAQRTFDANNAGWLVTQLAENLEEVDDLRWCVDDALARRGYDMSPTPQKSGVLRG